MVAPAQSGLSRREFHPESFSCPRCGLNLWRVLRKRAIRNCVEHVCCVGIGLAAGIPIEWHHVITLARLFLRPI